MDIHEKHLLGLSFKDLGWRFDGVLTTAANTSPGILFQISGWKTWIAQIVILTIIDVAIDDGNFVLRSYACPSLAKSATKNTIFFFFLHSFPTSSGLLRGWSALLGVDVDIIRPDHANNSLASCQQCFLLRFPKPLLLYIVSWGTWLLCVAICTVTVQEGHPFLRRFIQF